MENFVNTPAVVEKRKRGRPPKVRTPEEIAKMNAPKRPRGRPRKEVPVPDPVTGEPGPQY